MHYNFKIDLAIAHKTEVFVASVLEEVYGLVIVSMCDTKDYDIKARGKSPFGGGVEEMTFEVKEDFKCHQTGNIALEFNSRGRPSGISVSKADFYIYVINFKDTRVLTLHRTQSLKDMIKDEKYFRVVNGGDPGSNTYNYLFKYPVFLSGGGLIPYSLKKFDNGVEPMVYYRKLEETGNEPNIGFVAGSETGNSR